MINLPVIPQDIGSKKILVRLDLDVPLLEDGSIEDNTRLLAGIDTVDFLLDKKAEVFILGHLGRPDISDKESFKKLSLRSVALWFNQKYGQGFAVLQKSINGFPLWQVAPSLFVLENLRFFKDEEQPDTPSGKEFVKKLSSVGDIYVNDAFAVCHRSHASIVGLPLVMPHFAGLHLRKEIEVLSKVLENPARPLLTIIGGAKLETKLPLVESMHKLSDYVLVGGKIAWETRKLLEVQHEKIEGRKSALLIADLNEGKTDITDKSVENFLQIVNLCKTVVWNGPVGLLEGKSSDLGKGTKNLALGIIQSGAFSIIGGGDTEGFLRKQGLLDKFSFVSTGGGAMLDFLSGAKLPGIEILLN